MRRSGLFGLFFLSGAGALLYELAWQRLLTLVFGAGTLSVCAVGFAFLGGLALGALLFGRLADRTTRPLRLYAALQAGVALLALLVGPACALLTHVFVAVALRWQPGPWGGGCLRFGLSLLVLLPPAALLGGMLPVMVRLGCRRHNAPRAFSLLYAVHAFGAVAGAGLTGFVLVGWLGLHRTIHLGAALSGLGALGACLLERRTQASGRLSRPGALPPGADEPSPSGARLALACAALAGATAAGLAVAWARILGILTSRSTDGLALLLTVLLLGQALGRLLVAGWCRRPGDGWARLAGCQWLLAALTLAACPLFRTPPGWFVRCCQQGTPGALLEADLMLNASALLVPAILLGMSLPLLAAGVGGTRSVATWLGRLVAVHTLGCLLGACLAELVFVPCLGIQGTVGVCILCPALVGLAGWTRSVRPAPLARGLVSAGVLGGLGLGWCALPAGRFLKSPVEEPNRLLFYCAGTNGTVAVVGERDHERSLLVDGQPVAGTGPAHASQRWLAHLPLLLHPAPRRALTLGLGSGATSHSMTLHGIRVDCVEIEAQVVAAAEHFESANHGVLRHPRFRLVLDDPRSWLQVAPCTYDAIVADCTHQSDRHPGDLYTVDYFRLLKKRLTPDGVAAVRLPASAIAEADLKTLLRSFRAVFPHTSVWFLNAFPADSLVVVGTPEELAIDLDQWGARIARPGVAEDLDAVGFSDPNRLAYTFVTGERALDRYLGRGPLSTDDRPVLVCASGAPRFRSTLAANLLELLQHRTDVARHVKGGLDEVMHLRHYTAAGELLLGHVHQELGNHPQAIAHYIHSAYLLPQEFLLRDLILREYREHFQAH
jgi:spermidine synthase